MTRKRSRRSGPPRTARTSQPPQVGSIELTITSLAAGGDGVGRDDSGRVTFVPRATVGDRVRVKLVKTTKSFARGEILELVEPGPSRVEPPCEAFRRGCGGCQWQHVARDAQLAAKHAIVTSALHKLRGLARAESSPASSDVDIERSARTPASFVVHPVADPAPAFGWRRRARFHVDNGRIGLYAHGSHSLVELRLGARSPGPACPQLEPALDAALPAIAAARPPQGELELLLAHDGGIAVAVEGAWPRGRSLLDAPAVAEGLARGWPASSSSRIVAVVDGASSRVVGAPSSALGGRLVLEIEPGLWIGPRDFAQASRAGNAALIERVLAAVGSPTGNGRLLELHAGAGNLTRPLAAAGWDVHASDVVEPAHRPVEQFVVGAAVDVVEARAARREAFEVVVLDPPRTGAIEAMDGIARLVPQRIVYVSCDPATLARDLEKLVFAGYQLTDVWPIDLMPQTSHVEAVALLVR